MPRHLSLGQLLLEKKVTENTVTISLAAWPNFDELFCIFETVEGRHAPPTPQISTELYAKSAGKES